MIQWIVHWTPERSHRPERKRKKRHTQKNNIAHMNTDTNPRCACTNVPFPAYFYALAWGSRAMCATISVKIDGIQLSSSVSFSVLTIYTLHFWASVKKRRTHTHTQCPCRNCAIKRSEVSAHIFNTLMHWRIYSITQIINSHLKRFFHDLSLSLSRSLSSVAYCYKWTQYFSVDCF